MQLNLDSKGFSLAEMMISLGIVGVISLFTMNFMQDQAISESITKYRNDVGTSLSILQNSVNNRRNCDQMLKGKLVTAAGTELTDGLKIKSYDGIGEVSLLEVKEYPGFEVRSILLRTSALSTSSFDLVITFAPKPSKIYIPLLTSNRAVMTKTLTIVGTTDATQRVVSCSSIVSDSNTLAKKAFCDNLNSVAGTATWDPTAKTCVLNMSKFLCTGTNIPSALRSIGDFNCQSAASRLDYDKVFDFSIKTCPSKQYAVYLGTDGRYNIGCPSAGEKTGTRPLLQ